MRRGQRQETAEYAAANNNIILYQGFGWRVPCIALAKDNKKAGLEFKSLPFIISFYVSLVYDRANVRSKGATLNT
jgi:hypothetical protein